MTGENRDPNVQPADDGKDAAYTRAIAYAAAEGAERGGWAASWYFDGNTPQAHYSAVLKGIEDGDPAVLDTLPSPDLSGEWADTLTGPQLVADALEAAGIVHRDGSTDTWPGGHAPGSCEVCDWWDASGDICDAYETAFTDAAHEEIERVARYQVGPWTLEGGTK